MATHASCAQALTSVSGTLVADESWAADGSPYVITGDVNVPADVKLTLQPGVEIRYSGGSLVVDGQLSAIGTAQAPIYFVAADLSQRTRSVSLRGATARFEHVDVRGSETGIRSDGSDLTVLHSRFRDYTMGIDVSRGGYFADRRKLSVVDTYFDGSGMPATHAGAAIYGRSYSYAMPEIDIRDNVIAGGWSGIDLAGNPLPGLAITGNLIQATKQGIAVWETYRNERPWTISRNTITGNEIGVITAIDSLTEFAARDNNLGGNSEYAWYAAPTGSGSASDIPASDNWWGTTDADEIATQIFDGKTTRRVVFSPFLQQAPLTAPSADLIAPETTITASPAGATAAGAAEYRFASSEPGPNEKFECRFDSAEWRRCTSPFTAGPGLVEGTHRFAVRAIDSMLNRDTTPASHSFVRDATAPETSVASAPNVITNSTGATFDLSADEQGGRFECRLDDAEWSDCQPHTSYATLADGTHRFKARAVDAAGNADGSPAAYEWVVDSDPPETMIGDHPANPSRATAARFSLSSDEAAAFQCSLDNEEWVACSATTQRSVATDGPHTLRARAVDAAGNVDLEPASYTWARDTVAPTTTLSDLPSGAVQADASTATFSSPDPDATFQCAIDGASFQACTSPVQLGRPGDGARSFAVRAVDAAGNVDPAAPGASWTVDTQAPNIFVVREPTSPTNQTSVTVDLGVSEAAGIECQIDGGPWQECSANPTFALGHGSHALKLRATDLAGNVSASLDRAYIVDTAAPPAPTFATPGDGVEIDPGPSLALSGSAEAGSAVVVGVDGVAQQVVSTGTNGSWAASVYYLALGTHTISANAIDPAGNNSATATRTVVVRVPPVATPAAPSPSASSTAGSASSGQTQAPSTTTGSGAPTTRPAIVPVTSGTEVRDADGDGARDGTDNCRNKANVDQRDVDRDDRGDVCDDDDDDDGLPDDQERRRRTDRLDRDTDDDGLADAAEVKLRTNPRRPDSDGDGLSDGLERGTRRRVAGIGRLVSGTRASFKADRDPKTKTDARQRNSDTDCWSDGAEDANHNGRKDAGETDPTRGDTDGDGMTDCRDPKPLVKRRRPARRPSYGPGDRDCTDFATQQEAQAYFEAKGGSSSNNVDDLDRDHDGVACDWN